MTVSSLICEFDPLHNGHKLLLDHIRSSGADCIIACMSGNFTQRGEPAAFDKRTRARAALRCGADLVLELPVSFACAGAERFALGGVYVLNALGCVDSIFFGSECGDISMLGKACLAIESGAVSALAGKHLSCGVTFASARERAVRELYGNDAADILRSPNNILAVEYLKALNRLHSAVTPRTIKRIGACHGDFVPDSKAVGAYHGDKACTDTERSKAAPLITASASYLRGLMLSCGDIRPFMPEESYKVFAEQIPSSCGQSAKNGPHELGRVSPSVTQFPVLLAGRMRALEGIILYRLRTMTKEQLAGLPDIGEGLENRLYDAARICTSVPELLGRVKTKRYTMSRIKRLLMYALLGISRSGLEDYPRYARILGFNDRGRLALTEIKKRSSLPVITKASEAARLGGECLREFELESRCDDIYALSGSVVLPCGTNQSGGIVIEKKRREP